MHNDTPEFIDAPEFTEDEKRSEAESIVSEALDADLLECLQSFTQGDELEIVLSRVRKLVEGNEMVKSVLITNCLRVREIEIQANLEAEND